MCGLGIKYSIKIKQTDILSYMKFFMIGPYYINWHYTRGISELSKNLFNFIVFEFNFFSVKDLFLTLFAPFQRLKEDYGSSAIEFEKILSALVVNIIMRIIGFIVRSFILLAAFFCIGFSIILFPIAILAWLVLPVILLFFFMGSMWAYIKYKL